MAITQDEFNRMFGVTPEEPRPPGERTVFYSDAIPETCPCCHDEFVYDIQPGYPQTLLTECSCGQWRLVLVETDDDGQA